MVIFQTLRGPIPVWGQWQRGPLLFVVRGITPAKNFLLPLAQRFPSVALVHLPGVHTPFLSENSVEAFAEAFDEVIDQIALPAVALGVSMGGVVSLAMKRPQGLLLLDPTLRTPIPDLEKIFAPPAAKFPEAARWFEDIFGFRHDGWTSKDYRYLLDELRVPAHTLAGSRGYCRAIDVQHPLMGVTTVDAGHVISKDAPDATMDAIERLLSQAGSPTRQIL
jgi:pimeloyl-ACP methyl ester carboxylesterase